jgi:predicted aspartyl protease
MYLCRTNLRHRSTDKSERRKNADDDSDDREPPNPMFHALAVLQGGNGTLEEGGRMVRFYAAAMATVLLLSPLMTRADESYGSAGLTAVEVLVKAKAARGTLEPGTYAVGQAPAGTQDAAVETTYINGEDSITHVNAGLFSTASGTYHNQDWDQDENGTVTLDSDFYNHEDPDAVALAHPEEPANRVTMLGTVDNTYAIDIAPPLGEHQIRYYATDTFMLVREVRWEKDRLEHVATYGDYRKVYGAMEAFRETYSNGRIDGNYTLNTISFKRTAEAIDFHIPATRPLVAFTSTDPVVVPTRFIDGHIVVRVTIDGRALDFMLDTGSSDMVIGPDVAHDLGLHEYGKHGESIGGDVDTATTVVPDMTIGTTHLHNTVFSVLPISEKVDGARIVGLLGYDFISSAVLVISYADETLTFYPPGATLSVSGPLTAVPVELDDRAPRLTASVNGVSGKFMLDTGSEVTSMFRSYIHSVPHATMIASDVSGEEMIGGEVKTQAYSIDNLLLGPTQFQQVNVIVPQSSLAEIRDFDGIIGHDILSFFVIYLDYAHQQILLQQNH